jgi:hypothetical protein
MTDQTAGREPTTNTPRPANAPPRAEGVTGVASGALGTAANLDETQVLTAADLDAHQAVDAEPAIEAEPAVAPAASGSLPPAASAARVRPAPRPPAPAGARGPRQVEAAPVLPVVATGISRTAAGRPSRFGGLAGLLAVGLMLLVGLAILSTRGNGVASVGGTPPHAGSTPTQAVPTEKPKAGGKDKGHGNGNGNGNGEGND